jgi:hypothetical protein
MGFKHHNTRNRENRLRADGRVSVPAFLLLACLSAGVMAESDNFYSSGYAEGAAGYLAIPVHAHSAALGRAVTAWTGDFAGVQYNPAILDFANELNIKASYTILSDERKHMGMDGVCPIGTYLVAGAEVVIAGIDDIERRDAYGVVNETNRYFDYGEQSVALAAAGRLPYEISVGMRARYLNERFTEETDGHGRGMGFDAGAVWQPDSRVCIGVSGLNMLSWLWWETGTRNMVLPEARLGVAGIFLNKSLTAEIDFAKTLRQPIDVSCGLQYTILQIISVRAGLQTSVHVKRRDARYPDISAGLGIRYAFFGADYSINIPTDDPSALISHKFSLLLRFRVNIFN